MGTRLHFDALVVGRTYRHALTRTLTETDNLLASALIMSSEPLQLDAEFAAAASPSGERLCNSVFTMGLAIAISGHDLVYVSGVDHIVNASFPHPGRVGDTVRVESDVVALDPATAVACLRHRVITQRDDVIAIITRNARITRAPEAIA